MVLRRRSKGEFQVPILYHDDNEGLIRKSFSGSVRISRNLKMLKNEEEIFVNKEKERKTVANLESIVKVLEFSRENIQL